MKKIKINSREFYVIDGCSRENYTLCVAAEAWGKMQWAENGTPNVLDVANCNNPDSILYTWYEGVPEEIRKGMLLVSVTTADKCEKGYVQNLYGVRTFIPSYDEWKTVPQEIRKKIGVEFIWTRTLAAVDHNQAFAWIMTLDREFFRGLVEREFAIVPGFYLDNDMIEALVEEQKDNSAGRLLAEIDRKIKKIRETTFTNDRLQNEGIKTILINELYDVRVKVEELFK